MTRAERREPLVFEPDTRRGSRCLYARLSEFARVRRGYTGEHYYFEVVMPDGETLCSTHIGQTQELAEELAPESLERLNQFIALVRKP